MSKQLANVKAALDGDDGQHVERKSLRYVTGKTSDFLTLAGDCVAFANAPGGHILVGIEDGQAGPPADQRVEPVLADRIRRRIGELTVDVQVATDVRQDDNGGQYVDLIVGRAVGVASTSDGRYFLRVGDESRPIVGDDVLRLVNERPSTPWEGMTTLGVPRAAADAARVGRWMAAIRDSDRVKSSVEEKSRDELLDHYGLSIAGVLTNLGVLLLGSRADRAQLGTAPVVQAIKYDERGAKVSKHVWDDYTLSPLDLVDAIWSDVPDFRESYELPDGLFRSTVPAFDEVVIRELLVNALVHRPYTQRGDIFLNLHPDRLEVVNPGRLPLGVTPRNILHASQRRNDGLARVFHDLKLMEREGSGFDLMYERLLTSGRTVPVASEGVDSVRVVVPRRVVQPGVIRLSAEADRKFQLSQRERIALAMLALGEGLSAVELAAKLELPDPSALKPWTERLVELGLVAATGRARATRYFVPPEILRSAGLDRHTTLTRMQPHRLAALILEDLERYPQSSVSEIHRRVGKEIPLRTIKRTLDRLIHVGRAESAGERRWRRYRAAPPIDQGGEGGR
jgi:ATP-dependent DNA helicase RecG